MKSSRSVFFGRVLFWGCLLAFASPAQAALIASSSVGYNEGFFSGPGVVGINGPTMNGGGTSAVGYNSAVVPGLAASASATAEYGALHASAFSGVANPGQGLTSRAGGGASAFWSDQLTFSSATLTGQAFARATFYLSGGLASLSDPGSVGSSTVAAQIQAGGNTVFTAGGQLLSQSGVITTSYTRGQGVNGTLGINPVSDLTGAFIFDIPFVFGVGFTLTGDMTASALALSGVAGSVASANSNFGSTGRWGGISEVHLADGTVLSGYSLASTSGFDWANAFPSDPVSTVPVPATLWLFGAGLLGLIGVRRRPKHL